LNIIYLNLFGDVDESELLFKAEQVDIVETILLAYIMLPTGHPQTYTSKLHIANTYHLFLSIFKDKNTLAPLA